MSIELIIALITFAVVMSATPGPNNIMLTASGANFGVMRTLPHVVGIVFGVATMHIAIGLGLGAVFETWPALQTLLKVAGSGYLIWLGLKLLKFDRVSADQGDIGKPFTFIQAAGFQYINPKAWVMAISANATFSLAGDLYWLSVGWIILVFLLVGPPAVMVWVVFGQLIRQLLTKPSWLKTFNLVMALLTISCVVFIWWE